MDYVKLYNAFAELDDFVKSQPELSDFKPSTSALREQAQALARGSRVLPKFDVIGPKEISSKVLAARVVAIVSGIPPVEESEPAEVQLLVARLLGNLVDGVLGAIFSCFPDLIPREKAGAPSSAAPG